MTPQTQKREAKRFAKRWEGRGSEKSDSQTFWIDMLEHVFGVEDYANFISFETEANIDRTSFIDGYIESTKVLIEQKSITRDLRSSIRQADGSFLTPFQQARRYVVNLPLHLHPRWIITCNFKSFLIYDMENPNSEPVEILLRNFGREYQRLAFIVDIEATHLNEELATSKQAGEIIGELYDAILAQYNDGQNPSAQTLKSLNMLCVRIVFCLYAEDAGIFGRLNIFSDYIKRFESRELRRALLDLFKVLDTKEDNRDPYLEDYLKEFPYVNGGLFTEEDQTIPQLTDEIKSLLVTRAADNFNWAEISPAIFGAIFESTLNPETRRSGGMHYTSIENIHKVIDPLFLDDLKAEFERIKNVRTIRARNNSLLDFQKKLGSLKFLDPACGSGNFLTETYVCLRKIENECIRLRLENLGDGPGEGWMDVFEDNDFVHVKISQFYGIEINDFAVSVAKAALWIAESQMMIETAEILSRNLDFLPLRSYSTIIEGNALTTNWEDVVPKDKLSYIIGNPPFIGARMVDRNQRSDINRLFPNVRNSGNIDYVGCWFIKAKEMMEGTHIQTALVGTNSITQGVQPFLIFKPLIDSGIHINFAYRTFRWDSEARLKAHVHCVIIGFSFDEKEEKIINPNMLSEIKAHHINGYLYDAPDTLMEDRTQPICDVLPLLTGSQRLDNNNFMFKTDVAKEEFIQKEPDSGPLFKRWYGADEFIHDTTRWCLYLGNCTPAEINSMPNCRKIVENVRNYRQNSDRAATRAAANTPNHFGLEVFPEADYLVIPVVSSEKRKYIPMGFLTTEKLCSNQLNMIPYADIYYFGILSSLVHNAWMRSVCGRLKSDYRYSKDIVYNNFPWPSPTQAQKESIKTTAQKILDARNLYPDSSLADLYDEVSMPKELRIAHEENDKAVMKAYGFRINMAENDIVTELFKLHEQIIAN